MADIIQTPEEIAKGYDARYSNTLPTAPTPSLPGDGETNAAALSGFQRKLDHPEQGVFGAFGDALSHIPTVELIRDANREAITDPSFTPEKFSARFSEASKTLSPQYLGSLSSAVSDADFQYLYDRAKSAQNAEERLAEAGWTGTAATLLADGLDPASLALGLGTGKVAIVGAKLARLNKFRSTSVAIGAAEGAAFVGASEAVGPRESSPEEYLAAAALGAVLRGVTHTPGITVQEPIKAPAQPVPSPRSPIAEKRVKGLTEPQPEPIAPEPVKAPEPPTAPVGHDPAAAPAKFIQAKAKEVLRHIDDDLVVAPKEPVTIQFGDAASRKARFTPDEVLPEPANLDEAMAQHGEGSRVHEGGPVVDPAPAPKPEPADPMTVINDVVSGKKSVDELLQELTLTPANDTTRPVSRKTIGTAEELKLAESANTYKAPHRHELPSSLTRQIKFDLPAHIERDILHPAGPVVDRLRTMGIDVRSWFEGGKTNIFQRANGVYIHNAKLVAVQSKLGPQRIKEILEHEEIHALRQGGAFTDAEWRKLVAAARRVESLVDTGKSVLDSSRKGKNSGSHQYYKSQGIKGKRLTSLGSEEGVANLVGNEAFAGLVNDPGLTALITSIRDGSRARAVAAKKGIEIEASMPTHEDMIVVSEAHSPVDYDYLNNIGLRGLTEAQVPKTFEKMGLWRIDIAGWLGKSDNPITRILGDMMLNDSVGKKGHAVSGPNKEVAKGRLVARMQKTVDDSLREAIPEYAKSRGVNIGMFTRTANLNRDFQREVGRALRGTHPEAEWSPGVARAVGAHRKVYSEMLEYLKNPLKDYGQTGRGIKGAENLDPSKPYFTRKFHQGNLNSHIREHSFQEVAALVRKAIQNSNPGLSDDLLDRMSAGYLRRAAHAVNGAEEDFGSVLARGDSEEVAELLRTFGMEEGDIGQVISTLMGHDTDGAGTVSRLKHKQLLDETATHTYADATGKTHTLRFEDILVHDADAIMNNYLTRMAGRVALAQGVYKTPAGEVLIDGITSDREFAKLLQHVKEEGANRIGVNGYTNARAAHEVKTLQFAYDRLVGRPLESQQTQLADNLRLARSFNLFRLVNTGFFAQMIGESSSVMGQAGWRAATGMFPGVRAMLAGSTSSRLRNTIFEEMQAIGVGLEGTHGMAGWTNGIDDQLVNDAALRGKSARYTKAAQAIDTMNHGVSQVSRMPFITDVQQQWAAAAMAQKLYRMGTRELTEADIRRFNQLGVDEAMLKRIIGQIQTHGSREDGLFGSKINRLNFNSWADVEASAVLQDTLYRASRKMIQSRDVGMMQQWMTDPVWQTVLQFKSFSFLAYSNHSLYHAHMGDRQAAQSLVTSMLFGGVGYAAQTFASSVGRSDRDEYLADRLSPTKLGLAAFQRSTASSILPMIYDSTIPHLTNSKPLFDTRSSGQGSNSSSVWLSAPLIGEFDNAFTGFNAIAAKVFRGRDPSQAELRSLATAVPFGSFVPVSAALQYMMQNLPKRAPKATDLPFSTE